MSRESGVNDTLIDLALGLQSAPPNLPARKSARANSAVRQKPALWCRAHPVHGPQRERGRGEAPIWMVESIEMTNGRCKVDVF